MRATLVVVLSVMFAAGLCGMVVAGSLDSPGAPSAGSGMYTLQNLYDYLTSGAALTVQTSFQEPMSGPTAGTMKTTKEIGDAIKALLDQSNVGPDNVESGKKFFCTQPGSWGIQTGTLVALPRPTATPTSTPTITPTATYAYLASCKAILDAGKSTGDGTYTIDPDGPGGNAPFSAYCDMTTDDGGWTLVVTRASTTMPWTAAGYGTDLTSPTANTDNVYKGSWSKLGFNTVRYKMNNSTLPFYFRDITSDAVRDYAQTALYTQRNAQTYHPDCYSTLSGGSPYVNCGGLPDASNGGAGWIYDPAPGSYGGCCWVVRLNTVGTGNCLVGGSCENGGHQANIWVR